MKKVLNNLINAISLSTFLLIGIYCSAQEKVNSADPLISYNKGNSAYQNKKYDEAVRHYLEASQAGWHSPELEYNLGNAYYKTGDNARAILHYERALKLSPDDEEARFNLRIASLKLTDRIDVMPEVFYKRWIQSVSTALPEKGWTILFIVAVWITCLSLVSYFYTSSSGAKKAGFASALLFLFLSIGLGLLAGKSRDLQYKKTSSIVISPSVYVKSSPDEKGNDLFILHEGTKVEYLDEIGDWRKIRIANGSVGWLKAEAIENI